MKFGILHTQIYTNNDTENQRIRKTIELPQKKPVIFPFWKRIIIEDEKSVVRNIVYRKRSWYKHDEAPHSTFKG